MFTTRCPFCKETLPIWEKITNQAKGARDVALIGICLDEEAPTKAYVEEQKVTFPVFVAAEKESLVQANNLHSVPQTIIRARNGRVEKVWKGRLSQEKYDEVVKTILNSKE